jgi:hypothetical protein
LIKLLHWRAIFCINSVFWVPSSFARVLEPILITIFLDFCITSDIFIVVEYHFIGIYSIIWSKKSYTWKKRGKLLI